MQFSEVALFIAEFVFVFSVLLICGGCIGILIVAPEVFMRFSVRCYMYSRTTAERERICKKSDRFAYYYLGTTGSSERDARISGFDTMYGRGLGIATVLGFLGIMVFAVVHSLVT